MNTVPTVDDLLEGFIIALNNEIMPFLNNPKAVATAAMMQSLLQEIRQVLPVFDRTIAEEHNQMTQTLRDVAALLHGVSGEEADRIRSRASTLGALTDVPVPVAGDRGHLERTAAIAADLVRAARGGVFLLFTSHRDVREAARLLREAGIDREWPLLVHGEDGRDAILRRFRAHGDAVLVGTASFWEGVDVPGRALRALLLARIPFRVPSEPITAAHCEAIEAAVRIDDHCDPSRRCHRQARGDHFWMDDAVLVIRDDDGVDRRGAVLGCE